MGVVGVQSDVLDFEVLTEGVEQQGVRDADDKDVTDLDVGGALPRHDDRGALLLAGGRAARALLRHQHKHTHAFINYQVNSMNTN